MKSSKSLPALLITLLFFCSNLLISQYTQISVPDGGQATGMSQIEDAQTNTTHIFAEVTGKGIFELNGDKWSPGSITNDTNFIKLLVLDHKLFASFKIKGLYESTDYGLTWRELFKFDSVEYIQSIAGDDNNLFLAVSNHGKIYKSIDNKSTWNISLLPDTLIGRDIIFLNNGKFLCGTNKGILKTENNGDTWQMVDTLSFRSKTIRDLFIDKNSWIFASTPRGLYRSKNDGSTWEELTNGLFFENINFVFNYNDSTIIASTGIGTYYSHDSGDSWNEIDKKTDVVNVMGFAVTKDERIVASASYGLFISDYRLKDWSNYEDGFQNLTFSKFYPFAHAGNVNLLLGSDNKILFKKDTDNIWNKKFFGITFNTISQAPWGFIYLSSGMGGVLRSKDFGETFDQFYSNNSRGINQFAYDSKGNVYGALNSPSVVITTNQSETWDLYNKGIDSLRGVSIAIDSKDNKYCIAFQAPRNSLFTTKSDTNNWIKVNFATPIPRLTEVITGTDDALYVLSDSLGIVKINNDLTDYSVFFSHYRLKKIIINRFNQIITYTSRKVYFYNNGWDSLSFDFSGHSVDIVDAYLAFDNSLYILTRTTMFKSNTVTAIEILPNNDNLQLDISPNPTDDFIKINFTDNQTGDIFADIYDLDGRKFTTQNISRDNKVNIGSLPKGAYIIVVTLKSGEVKTGKFIKF